MGKKVEENQKKFRNAQIKKDAYGVNKTSYKLNNFESIQKQNDKLKVGKGLLLELICKIKLNVNLT